MTEKEFNTRGFVINESKEAFFKLQRQLPPGRKLSFTDAYKSVGKKSGKEGKDFVRWLKENFFPEPYWGFYQEEGQPFFSEPVATETQQVMSVETSTPTEPEGKGAGKVLKRDRGGRVKKGTEITPSVIIDADYLQAKNLIEECKSRDVLKKALTLSQHFANKSEHMRHLMRRLEQVR